MGRILDAIASPDALKSLSDYQLAELAQEIRDEIIRTVSHTGGHLAPNLGVVELTIALHATLSSPKDKIIWDVGHQSYAHKLLTGRKDRFHTLRQYGGISGFPKRKESEHDVFDTGHSSTSISAALGIAKARDLKGEHFTVVAVIGDGSMTGGMAFEALNHAGHLGLDLIVVLNDNEMSISPNVGALSRYLSRLRTNPKLRRVQDDIEHLVRRLPIVGEEMGQAVKRLKDGLKHLVVPGMLFEELGFTYLGPVDGHDIWDIRRTLRDAIKKGGPVLIHVLTKKGKGYGPAERNPKKFHGTGPFIIETGQPRVPEQKSSYTKFFGDALVRLAEKNKRIIAITAAMPDGTGLDKFAARFPERFFDVGIAEQHGVTLAAGLASQGMLPVVAIYSAFLQRAYDQIVHDVCLQRLPVVFAIDRAGIVGEDGPTHHGVLDLAYLRQMPGMVIMSPMDENELQHMLITACNYGGPAAIRYPRALVSGTSVEPEMRSLPIGKAEVIYDGTDVAILAFGTMVSIALEAAEGLIPYGLRPAVINMRYASPLDTELIIDLATRMGRLLTIEEGVLAGGFGSGVIEALNNAGINGARVARLGLPSSFVEHGPRDVLLEKYGLSRERVTKIALELCEDNGKWAQNGANGAVEKNGVTMVITPQDAALRVIQVGQGIVR